ncbi:copper chaperone PCu(A)C [Microbulbifer hainanensis]|uniref:copper chaperone PCu(A)C n=1 Tax=Microbulbifer hainanensis TaxID=2735675 RepID=UPI0018683F14|nr:copper chaperone PCu(A)C [Microbulbifer hainanensis]
MKKLLAMLGMAALTAWINTASANEAALTVQGVARETLPGAGMSAAYLSLHNSAAAPRQLLRVELPGRVGASADLHTTVTDGGVIRMRPLAQLTIPADGNLAMAPGGIHLMLHGVQLRAGEALSLRLVFADGEALDVSVPVRRAGARPDKAEHHQHG